MNKSLIKPIQIAAIVFATSTFSAHAFDLKDILNKAGETISNGSVEDIIEGVFSTSDIEVADLQGEWTSTGSAVSFQSENFLNKAGGIAAASTIESEINPYYEKFGLTGAVFTIEQDGTFTLKTAKSSFSGTFKKADDGNFLISFNSIGKILGEIPTYIQKSSTAMDIMFDVSKLQKLLSAVASVSKISTLETLSKLLNSYDGICVGFKLKKNGSNSSSSSSDGVSSLLNNIIGNSNSSNSTTTNTSTQETKAETESQEKTTEEKTSNALNALKGLFGK